MNQCEDVLVWLQRLLPFSDFLNATDDVLDGILTMLSELPLNNETIDLLARYFHNPALSIPTTDKLNRMTRKIRNKAEGLETSESLTVRFQQQCEKRRKEKNKISSFENNFLEVIPEFCKSVDYQHDIAFLHFLDTFLLITLAKNITSEDYKKAPLILPYKDKPTPVAEISPIEKTTRRKEKACREKSFGIKRSQSFQDVGNIKKKPESSLLSPDDLDSDKPVNRSNSLTDLRRVHLSSFSEELQAFLPTLLWLKRWCLIEEYQKGNQGANKSYSFLNMTTTPTAIRVQLPLKLVVNTLWLIENYYKDFALAKGKCLRNKCSRVKKKRSYKKEIVRGQIEENVLVEETKHQGDVEAPVVSEVGEENRNMDIVELRGLESRKNRRSVPAVVGEENEKVDEVGARRSELSGLEEMKACVAVGETKGKVDKGDESVAKRQSQVCEKERRRRKRGAKDAKQKVQMEDQLEKTATARESEERGNQSRNEIGKTMEGIKVAIKTGRKVDKSEGVKVELPKQKMGKRTKTNISRSLQQQGDRSSQSIDEISAEHRTFVDDRRNESDGSIIKPHKYLCEELVDNDSLPVSHSDEGEVLDQTFKERGSVENISSTSRIKKNLFASPTSSSVGSKWKSLESVDADIPLLSFTHLNRSKNVSFYIAVNISCACPP